MEYLKAYTKDTTPALIKDYFGLGGVPNCSDDVLVVLECGSKCIAKVAFVDDELTWYSCCSESWDITEQVSYWSYIPEMMVEVQTPPLNTLHYPFKRPVRLCERF